MSDGHNGDERRDSDNDEDRRFRVHISADQIPLPDRPLPVFELGSPCAAPESLLQGTIDTVAPGAGLVEVGERGLRAAHDGERLVAFVHPETGASYVYPSLEALTPGAGIGQRARELAAKLLEDRELFPADGTRVIARDPIILAGAKYERGRDLAEREEYLGYVRYRRCVEDTPVFGPGTSAAIAVAADGSIRGLAHRWRPATRTERLIEPSPREQVAESIREQCSAVAKAGDVRVDRVTLAYYDAGKDYLQPVYRFLAAVDPQPTEDDPHPARRRVFGFVSVGDAPEPLPVLGSHPGPMPEHPQKLVAAAAPAPGDPTVGRYVVRNDTDEWVKSANEFMSGLKLAESWFHGIPFTDQQYYWAEPWVFTSDKDDYINSVHVGLNEVHGNWWWFSTRDNNDDGVNLSDIPASGYGSRRFGPTLAYWIIHSCEVIPTATDESTSFDVWWNIFKGLHATVGYRTEMWIDDDVTGGFGEAIGLGAAVVPAWLQAVATNDSYDDGDTYHDGNRGIDEPMGRASAIAVTGHGDDIVSNVAPLGPANSLTEWWFNN
jgi:hypothetical protein